MNLEFLIWIKFLIKLIITYKINLKSEQKILKFGHKKNYS